jgi:hypothetical protein
VKGKALMLVTLCALALPAAGAASHVRHSPTPATRAGTPSDSTPPTGLSPTGFPWSSYLESQHAL